MVDILRIIFDSIKSHGYQFTMAIILLCMYAWIRYSLGRIFSIKNIMERQYNK